MAVVSPVVDDLVVAAEESRVAGGGSSPSASSSATPTALGTDLAAVKAAPAAAEATPNTVSVEPRPAYPAPVTAPVTWHSIVTESLSWMGLGGLTPGLPIPAAPVPDLIAGAWVGLRKLNYTLFNSRPTLHPNSFTENPDSGAITGNLGGVDVDGDVITYRVTAAPAHGTVEINHDDSTYIYTPDATFAHVGGTDSFTVTAADDADNPRHSHIVTDLRTRLMRILSWFGLANPPASSTKTIALTVAPVNTAPTLAVEIGDPDPDTGAIVITPHTTDADGDPVTVTLVAAPTSDIALLSRAALTGDPARTAASTAASSPTAKGSVAANGDGTYTYTPTSQARLDAHTSVGDDTDLLTVTAIDGQGGTTTSALAVPVHPAAAVLLGTVQLTSGDVAYGPDGTAYQTSTDNDTTSVLVITTADPTTPTTLTLTGTPTGGMVFSPDGSAFQTTSATAGGQTTTYVTQIIAPDTTYSATLSGSPVGAPVFNAGSLYQSTSASGFTTVWVVTPNDPSDVFASGPLSAIGSGVQGSPTGGLTFGPDGTAYQQFATTSNGDTTTTLLVLSQDDASSDDSFGGFDPGNGTQSANILLTGGVQGDLLFGPDGTAYVYHGADSNSADATLTLITFGDSGFATATAAAAGDLIGGVLFGPDGTAYQNYRTADGASQVLAIDPSDPANTVPIDVPGYGYLVFGSDGTAYQTPDGGGGEDQTTITVIDPTDPAHPTTFNLAGPSRGPVLVGPDGTAYQQSEFNNPDGSTSTQVLVFDPSDPTDPTSAIYYTSSNLLTPNTSSPVVAGPNGYAYQSAAFVPESWNGDVGTPDPYSGTVIISADAGVLGEIYFVNFTGLRNIADPADSTGPDAIDYTVGDYIFYNGSTWEKLDITGQSGDTVTQLAVINPDKPAEPSIVYLAGDLDGPVVVAPDGTIYLAGNNQVVVFDATDPTDSTVVDFEINQIGLVYGPEGTIYQTGSFQASDSSPATTTVKVIAPTDPANATVTTMPGSANDVVLIGTDGSLYQHTNGGSEDAPISYITVIDPSNPAGATTLEIAGFSNANVVFGPDGTAYEQTSTHLLVIDPTDPSNAITLELTGNPVGGLVFSSGGTAYQTISTDGTTQVTVINPVGTANPATVNLTGNADGAIVAANDSIAYQLVTTGAGADTTYTLAVVKVASSPRAASANAS